MAMKFNINTPLGIAGGLWLVSMLEGDRMPGFWKDLNPQLKAGILVFAGDFLPRQKFARNFLKNAQLREGLGAGFQAAGIKTLMEEFGLAGVGQTTRLRDDDILAVAIEGDYYDAYDEDVLGEDDIDVINDDIVDDDEYQDDIRVINEDVLGNEDDDDDDDDDDVIWS